MTQFFCAEHSHQSGVDIIGSAPEHEIYVAIECSPPWASSELKSKSVPDNLRELSEEIYGDYDRFKTRFLLIHSENLKQENFTRLLIFRKPSGLAKEYLKQEFLLADIQDIAPLVRDYLAGNSINAIPIETSTRDILICTHGSRDRCCSRFGNPIYHQALKIVEERSLDHIRIWQASHIGGHRMAPTAIDFPEARYYGYLNPSALTSILTRTGNIQDLATLYRGWGILPWAAQVVEKELLLTHGWNWFNYKATAKVLQRNEEETFNQIELTYQTATDEQQTYRADVVADIDRTLYLRGSCNSEKASKITPYLVNNLTLVQAIGTSQV